MRKLYLTSYTFETEKGERVKNYQLVVVTKAEIEKMFPGNKAICAGEDVASKKLIAFMAIQNPSIKIIEIMSSDAIDSVGPDPLEWINKWKRPTDHDSPIFTIAFMGNELPLKNGDSGNSDSVLIDLEGDRTEFIHGYYNFIEQNWVEQSTGDIILVDDNMRWIYLPLAKYDK